MELNIVDLELNKSKGSAIGLEYQILDNKIFSKDDPQKYRIFEMSDGDQVIKKESMKNRGVASLYDLTEAESIIGKM